MNERDVIGFVQFLMVATFGSTVTGTAAWVLLDGSPQTHKEWVWLIMAGCILAQLLARAIPGIRNAR